MGDGKYILDYYINNIKVSSDEWAETLQAARKGFCREIYLEPCRYSPRSSEDIPAAKLRYIWQKLIEYALDDITINKPVAKFNVRSPTKLLATALLEVKPATAHSNTPKVHCTLDYTCAKHNTSTVFFDDNISVPP